MYQPVIRTDSNTGDCREEIIVPTSKAFKRNPKGFYYVRPLIAKLQKKIRDVEENCPRPDQLAERLVELGVKEIPSIWLERHVHFY